MFHTSHATWSVHSSHNLAKSTLRTIKRLVTYFSTFPCYFLPLTVSHFPLQPDLKYPQSFRHLRLSQWCCWISKSSGMWRRVITAVLRNRYSLTLGSSSKVVDRLTLHLKATRSFKTAETCTSYGGVANWTAKIFIFHLRYSLWRQTKFHIHAKHYYCQCYQ